MGEVSKVSGLRCNCGHLVSSHSSDGCEWHNSTEQCACKVTYEQFMDQDNCDCAEYVKLRQAMNICTCGHSKNMHGELPGSNLDMACHTLGCQCMEYRKLHDAVESIHKALYEGGATRSEDKVDYTLLSKYAMEALGRRHTLGCKNHGRNNWRQGGEDFRRATINHLMDHLLDLIDNGDPTGENTDAICNAAFLCYFHKTLGPYGGNE